MNKLQARLISHKSEMLGMRQEGWTLQMIGNVFGVTKEAVRLIIPNTQRGICCNRHLAERLGFCEMTLLNLRLRGLLKPRKFGGVWIYDEEEQKKAEQLVKAWRDRRRRVWLKCGMCGCNFSLPAHDYRARAKRRKMKVFFCSKKCYGRYLGLKYGRGALALSRVAEFK